MPYIDPKVVLEAKKMDLLTYLKNFEPHELVRLDKNNYTTRTHDSLKISNGKWMWLSRGIGGTTALNYLIEVNSGSVYYKMIRFFVLTTEPLYSIMEMK